MLFKKSGSPSNKASSIGAAAPNRASCIVVSSANDHQPMALAFGLLVALFGGSTFHFDGLVSGQLIVRIHWGKATQREPNS